MANETEHIEFANRTNNSIKCLLDQVEITSPWVATLAFYKALHLVEAAFFNDPAIRHTGNHTQREIRLKTIRKYDKIYSHYSVLSRAALNARYLSNSQCFDTYFSPEKVLSELLFHDLHQIEKSVVKNNLSTPDKLILIDTLKTK